SGALLLNRTVQWSTLDTSVADITSTGVLNGKKTGRTGVHVKVDTKTADVPADITPMPVASLVISPTVSSLSVGANAQLAATTRDSDGVVLTDRPVTWASTNAAAATVSATGLVAAMAAGTTSIQATAEGITTSQSL